MRARLLWPLLALILAQPLWADARMNVLVEFMKLNDAVAILADEGMHHARELNDEMLEGQGGAAWDEQVRQIYRQPFMVESVRAALEEVVTGTALEEAVAFYGSELGQKIVDLENAARAAIIDDAVEQAARARYADMAAARDPRLDLVIAFAATGDMVERNVTAVMNANYQFMRGMADGDALEMTEDEMLADVAAELDEIRGDTEGWLYGYFLMAYNPLSDDELRRYIAFGESGAGQAVNRALFDGFGSVYETISYALGLAVARNMLAEEL